MMRVSSWRLRVAMAAFGIWTIAGSILADPVDGGVNRHGRFRATSPLRFPPLHHPRYIAIGEANLDDNQPMLGLAIGDDARCFPLRLMWYHHIVNDTIGGQELAVTYCVMANTAVVYRLDDTIRGGLCVGGLFGGVLVLREMEGDRVWPQIADVPIPGNPTSHTLTLGPAPVLTTFGRWKAQYPSSRVLVPVEKFDVQYLAYDRRPEGYRPNAMLNETVTHNESRMKPGDEVLGVVIEGKAKAYPLSMLREVKRIDDAFGGRDIHAVWDSKLNTARVIDSGDDILWMRAFWYAWSSFYPETEILNREEEGKTP